MFTQGCSVWLVWTQQRLADRASQECKFCFLGVQILFPPRWVCQSIRMGNPTMCKRWPRCSNWLDVAKWKHQKLKWIVVDRSNYAENFGSKIETKNIYISIARDEKEDVARPVQIPTPNGYPAPQAEAASGLKGQQLGRLPPGSEIIWTWNQRLERYGCWLTHWLRWQVLNKYCDHPTEIWKLVCVFTAWPCTECNALVEVCPLAAKARYLRLALGITLRTKHAKIYVFNSVYLDQWAMKGVEVCSGGKTGGPIPS